MTRAAGQVLLDGDDGRCVAVEPGRLRLHGLEGKRVVLHSLTRADLNGREGTCGPFSVERRAALLPPPCRSRLTPSWISCASPTPFPPPYPPPLSARLAPACLPLTSSPCPGPPVSPSPVHSLPCHILLSSLFLSPCPVRHAFLPCVAPLFPLLPSLHVLLCDIRCPPRLAFLFCPPHPSPAEN